MKKLIVLSALVLFIASSSNNIASTDCYNDDPTNQGIAATCVLNSNFGTSNPVTRLLQQLYNQTHCNTRTNVEIATTNTPDPNGTWHADGGLCGIESNGNSCGYFESIQQGNPCPQ